jgi:hypothetical protein
MIDEDISVLYLCRQVIDYHQTDLQIQLFFINFKSEFKWQGVLSLKGEVFDLIL